MFSPYRSFYSSAGTVGHPPTGSISQIAMRLAVMIICLLPCWATLSEAAPAREPSPLTIKQIHSGHSLTVSAAFKCKWLWHLQAMINDIQPGSAQVGKSTIPGSSMSWRWSNARSNGTDARAEIADWEMLVITEAVPLSAYHESPEWRS